MGTQCGRERSGGCGCNVARCAIQASLFAAEENIQTHGGMGFTWEFDCQFYYRRAKLLSLAVGSEKQWQGRLVDGLAAQHNETKNKRG